MTNHVHTNSTSSDSDTDVVATDSTASPTGLRGRSALIVAGALVVAVAGTAVVAATVLGGGSPLLAAEQACSSEESVSVLDDGQTLVVDTKLSEYSETDMKGVECLFNSLETPSYVTQAMFSTTAMMGVQQEQVEAVDYRWTYHPDNGLQIIVTTGGA